MSINPHLHGELDNKVRSTCAPTVLRYRTGRKLNTASLVTLALEQGFRAIDTACQPRHYSENLVGDAVARSSAINREDLFLQTKFTLPGGQDWDNIPYDANAPLEDQVRQSFAKSLQNLRTEYLDALLLHSPARTLENTAPSSMSSLISRRRESFVISEFQISTHHQC